MHCLLNISINFHTLPLSLINRSLALGGDPFRASVVSRGVWKHRRPKHDVYQQFEPRAECVLLETCLGSRSPHLVSGPPGHSSGVSWCLWGSRIFSSSLSASMGSARRTTDPSPVGSIGVPTDQAHLCIEENSLSCGVEGVGQ